MGRAVPRRVRPALGELAPGSEPAEGDKSAAITEHDEAGEPARKWPLRYFIRRMTWHTLDHAWEMEGNDLTGEGEA